jgi:hypothetical protein
MTPAQWFGVGLMAVPFVAAFLAIGTSNGWRAAVVIYFFTAFVVSIIWGGALLASGEWP